MKYTKFFTQIKFILIHYAILNKYDNIENLQNKINKSWPCAQEVSHLENNKNKIHKFIKWHYVI